MLMDFFKGSVLNFFFKLRIKNVVRIMEKLKAPFLGKKKLHVDQ